MSMPPSTVGAERQTARRPILRATVPGQAPACACCQGESGVELAHEQSGEQIHVCPRCLRSSMRMQADRSEERNQLLLRDYAREYGFQVWKTDAVVYLLPPESPFSPRQ